MNAPQLYPLVVVRARRGAGVQWTPLRSRSTDRAGRRDLEPSRPVWAYALDGNKETSRFLIASSIKSSGKTQHCMCFARLRRGKQVPPTKVGPSYMHFVPSRFKCSITKISSTANAILLILIIERETGLEPATPTLARWCSTN